MNGFEKNGPEQNSVHLSLVKFKYFMSRKLGR